MIAVVCPPELPGPDTSPRRSSLLTVTCATVVGLPVQAVKDPDGDLEGRPGPDSTSDTPSSSILPYSVIDTISREPLVAAALAGVEIPTAHAVASKAALSTRENVESAIVCVSAIVWASFSAPPRTLHAVAIRSTLSEFCSQCHRVLALVVSRLIGLNRSSISSTEVPASALGGTP